MRQNSCTATRTGADKYMKGFFRPNKAKILLASRLCIGLLATLMLKIIPPQFDILDLREIPNLLANLLGRWPIRLFDMLTASQFAAKGEGRRVSGLPQFRADSFHACARRTNDLSDFMLDYVDEEKERIIYLNIRFAL